ncbi:MAG: FAD-binding oxidoreductase [Chlamydiota bacterium]|nr:FAD-binding oxidoreductase [Chlamydiota bacterium]
MTNHQTNLTGWGNYPTSSAYLHNPRTVEDLEALLNSPLPRGCGRSYGDAALNSSNHIALMEGMNQVIDFDPNTGIIKAEAGCTLNTILKTYTRKGWFPSVTPGTKFVTLGGCLAADVHGKNHHIDGSFSNYIKSFNILLADGNKVFCSPSSNSDLFWATVGGMGLTGIVTDVTMQLQRVESSFINVTHYDAPNLSKAIDYLTDPKIDEKYSVAWIDCLAKASHLGRSVVMNGRHCEREEIANECFPDKNKTKLSVPFHFPSWTLNPLLIKSFNTIFYNLQKNKQSHTVFYDSYFYPLDAVNHWNRLYGKNGFIQYQFVVPLDTAEKALSEILDKISKSKRGSFLAVLKKFGPQGKGLLSFPKEGMTLALDFPVTDLSLFSFLDDLDVLVIKYGGRTYLAKDSRMKPEVFREMYPNYKEWLAVKEKYDPENQFQSDLSRRLEITPNIPMTGFK